MRCLSVAPHIRNGWFLRHQGQHHQRRQVFMRRHFASWKVDAFSGLVWDPTRTDSAEPLYQVIVGLEIHAQLDIATKLFSSAPSASALSRNLPPNTNLDPFDVATPGYLPQLSLSAVRAAVLASAALNCTIAPISRFERKHYFYADLPASYQITQQRWPLATNGSIQYSIVDHKRGNKRDGETSMASCGIQRIQLEQDTGKTTTGARVERDPISGQTTLATDSYVDFDRAGCALIEIVTDPDLRSSKGAAALVSQMRHLLQHVGACRGHMEDGELRVDCNINLQRLTDGVQSPRVEVKNLNSIQQVAQATDYEALRQAYQWDTDGTDDAYAETRTWNAASNKTVLMRRKDGEEDYRFMPEPDLPPLVLDESVFDGSSLQTFLENNLPELPVQAIQRLQELYGLSKYQATVIAGGPPAIKFFDDTMKVIGETNAKVSKRLAKLASNLLCNELFALVKERAEKENKEDAYSIQNGTVTAEQLGTLVLMHDGGKISTTMAKKILRLLFSGEVGADPRQVASDRGMELISEEEQLRTICMQVISDHPEKMEVYRRGGKFATKIQKLLTGKAMAASRGNAHPERLQEVLVECLEELDRK